MGRMTTSRHGLVRFNRAIVNLDHITYARVAETSEGKWKLTLQFVDEKQGLFWTYNTEADAGDAFNRFERLITQEIVEELP